MLGKEWNKTVGIRIFEHEQSVIGFCRRADLHLSMISTKKQSIFISGVKLIRVIEAGTFFLFVYVVDNGRKYILTCWKKYVDLILFTGTEAAFGR